MWSSITRHDMLRQDVAWLDLAWPSLADRASRDDLMATTRCYRCADSSAMCPGRIAYAYGGTHILSQPVRAKLFDAPRCRPRAPSTRSSGGSTS